MTRRITMKDVAALAGVSHQTVSRVINDKGEVSPPVRARVREAITALGYHPSAIARSMVTGRTQILGCITNTLDFSFTAQVEGAKSVAQASGRLLLIASTSEEEEIGPLCNEMVSAGRVDGLLVIEPYVDGRHRFFEPLIARGAPIVYAGDRPRGYPVPAVWLDNESGGYQAAQHLVALGHTRIAMILGPLKEQCVQSRRDGFEHAFRDLGLQPPPRLEAAGDWSEASGYDAMRRLLAMRQHFTALFAQNDRMAVGAIRALRDKGLCVPGDVSVVGFGDLPIAAYFDPPLTTIHEDLFDYGRQAMRLLIKRIENPDGPVEFVSMPCELVARASTRAIR